MHICSIVLTNYIIIQQYILMTLNIHYYYYYFQDLYYRLTGIIKNIFTKIIVSFEQNPHTTFHFVKRYIISILNKILYYYNNIAAGAILYYNICNIHTT